MNGTADAAGVSRKRRCPPLGACAFALGAAGVYGGFALAHVRIGAWPPAAAALVAALAVWTMWRLAGALRSYRLALDPRVSTVQAAALLAPFYVLVPCFFDPLFSADPLNGRGVAIAMGLPWMGVALGNWVLGTRQEPRRPGRVIALGIAAIWAGATVLGLQRYLAFGDPELGHDTACLTQCMWTTLHGRFFAGPLLDELLFVPPIPSHFAARFSPILLALLPFFAALPHALTLIALRNAAIAAVAWPAYRIARRRLEPGPALVAAFLPLAHPAVWYATQVPIAVLPFAAFPLLMAMDAVLDGHRRRAWLWCLGSLAVREDVAFAVFALGIWAMMVRRDPRHIVCCVAAAAWFMAVRTFVMPMFGDAAGRELSGMASGLYGAGLEVVASVARNPIAALRTVAVPAAAFYLFRLLRPAMFLPFASLSAIVAAPALLAGILAGPSGVGSAALRSHEAVIPAAVFAVGALSVAGRAASAVARRMRDHWLDAARLQYIAVVALFCSAGIGAFDVLDPDLSLRYIQSGADRAAWNAIARVRPGDSVAAAAEHLPALARRGQAYVFDRLGDYPGDPAPDVVLVDTRIHRFGFAAAERERHRAAIDRIQADARYAPVFDREGIVLFRRQP